jgi:hypothetical protein
MSVLSVHPNHQEIIQLQPSHHHIIPNICHPKKNQISFVIPFGESFLDGKRLFEKNYKKFFFISFGNKNAKNHFAVVNWIQENYEGAKYIHNIEFFCRLLWLWIQRKR